MRTFLDFLEEKNWLHNIKSTGECTPMTKPTCTGRKLAFAKRVHGKGDIRQANLKKGKNKRGKD